MIHLYIGRGRSGKSHNCIEHVLIPYLEAGRTIVTNIPLRMPDGSRWDGETGLPYALEKHPKGEIIYFDSMEPLIEVSGVEVFDQSFFMNFDRFPKGSVFLIDEAWRYWPAGLRQDKLQIINKQFFKEHGHRAGPDGRTTEIILITQNYKDLATFVLSVVDKTFRSTKMDMVGAKGMYNIDIFQEVPSSDRAKGYDSSKGSYKKEIFKYYISHTDNECESNDGVEEIKGDRSNFMIKALVKLVILAVLFVIALFVVIDLFNPDSVNSNVEVVDSVDSVNYSEGSQVQKEKVTRSVDDFLMPDEGYIYISGHIKTPQLVHFFRSDRGNTFTSNQLRSMGYVLKVKSLCSVSIVDSNGLEMLSRCGFGVPSSSKE